MLGYIKLTKGTPARTVMLTVVWAITGIIIPAGFNLVFRAVTLTPDSFGTIWVSAWFKWQIRHEKPPRRFDTGLMVLEALQVAKITGFAGNT